MTAARIKIPSRIVLLCFIFLFLILFLLQMREKGNHTSIPFLSVLTSCICWSFLLNLFAQDHPPPLGLSAISAIKPSANSSRLTGPFSIF